LLLHLLTKEKEEDCFKVLSETSSGKTEEILKILRITGDQAEI
jgi:hypothetical protein